MNKIRNILVPVDFSEESKSALDSALSLARETGARLIVLHVFDKTGEEYREATLEYFARLHGVAQSSVFAPTLDRWLQEKSLDLCNFIQSVLQEPGKIIINRRVDLGRPVGNIMRAAKEENADLIVLAIKHRRFFPYFMGRSILLKLALRSRCPVLLIGTYRETCTLPPFIRRRFMGNQRIPALELEPHAAYPAR
jgi:universal stress protein A